MRIRVHLRAPPPIVIPLNYAHQLTSVVYRLLRLLFFSFLTADAWGQSVSLLLGRLPETYRPLEAIIDSTKELDKHYIPWRYPNGFDEGAPLDYYTKDEATRMARPVCGRKWHPG
jgi:HEPN domain-containing protein